MVLVFAGLKLNKGSVGPILLFAALSPSAAKQGHIAAALFLSSLA